MPLSSTASADSQTFCRLLNADHGIGNAVRLFRIGEVRHQRHLTDIFQRTKLLPDRVHPFRLEAQTVHPAVHFEIDIQRGMQLRVWMALICQLL